MHAAKQYGVQRITAEVEELLHENGRVIGVRTADGSQFIADKIILATGAWTSSLLSPLEDKLNIQYSHRIERQIRAVGVVSAYYRATDEEISQLDKAPVVMYGDLGQVIPASPENRLTKYTNSRTMFTNTVTTSSGQKITVPPGGSQYDVPDSLKRVTEEIITTKVMPRFAKGREADYWRICWDARTPTQDWLMCRYPRAELNNLFLAVGGSFQAYKCV
jgi:sarcosine oxidase/L-pipecolate oxidase